MKNSSKILLSVYLIVTLVVIILFVAIIRDDIKLRKENEAMKQELEQIETKEPAQTSKPLQTEEASKTEEPLKSEEPVQTMEAEKTEEPVQTKEVEKTEEPVQTKEVEKTIKPVETKEPEKTKEPAQTLRPNYTKVPLKTQEPDGAVTLVFAGDILLSQSMTNTYSKNNGEGIVNVLSHKLVSEFNNADIAMVNQEFPFSTRGSKMPNKQYTFRTDPKYVSVFTDMGVDIVSLANNHTLDYGRDAFHDTFTVLDNAGIEYIGGGINLDRAKQAFTTEVEGKKITFLAASRVLPVGDWYAKDNKSGLFQTYDPTQLCEEIKKAEKDSDFTVVYVHWGKEHHSMPENYQRNMAKQYIDAGADAVIGCHTHCLQGIEFYKGKPVVYSLGNFMFGNSIKSTMMYKLVINEDDSVTVNITPCKSISYKTYPLIDEAEKEKFFVEYQKICFNAQVDSNGDVWEYK